MLMSVDWEWLLVIHMLPAGTPRTPMSATVTADTQEMESLTVIRPVIMNARMAHAAGRHLTPAYVTSGGRPTRPV